MEKIKQRISFLSTIITIIFSSILVRLAYLVSTSNYQETAQQQSTYTVKTGSSYGTIYDSDFQPLVNDTNSYTAVINPTPEAIKSILPYLKNKDEFYESVSYGTPFACSVNIDNIENDDINIFSIPVRNSKKQLAQHLIGYTQDGHGVTGLEADYDNILRSESSFSCVTFTVNGLGGVMSGEQKLIRNGQKITSGLVTTLKTDIQRICETRGKLLKKGCVIIMDIKTGDILGSASFPSYTLDTIENALNNEDSPLINRTLYSYSVGSIFKLVTSTCAIENGLESFFYNCTGKIEIGTQTFHCHNLEGHGIVNLEQAMTYSCNPYFIALSKHMQGKTLLQKANELGFGKSIKLSESIIADKGTLPTSQEILLPAEKANFCFGQGFLTASPLQVARLTCAIANGGKLPEPRLIRGITKNGVSIESEKTSNNKIVFNEETAEKLQKLMVSAAYGNTDFNGVPDNVTIAAKTSTAQTGRFDENNEEYCHGWVTGFFPVNNPKYAVTVLAEDGGYGNESAAPIFREIISDMIKEGF